MQKKNIWPISSCILGQSILIATKLKIDMLCLPIKCKNFTEGHLCMEFVGFILIN